MPSNITYKILEQSDHTNETLDIDTLKDCVDKQYEEFMRKKSLEQEDSIFDDLKTSSNDKKIIMEDSLKESDHCSEIAAKALHYETNINRNKLQHICNYYNISYRKMKKPELAFNLAKFELDPVNYEIVEKRETLWNYYETLKKDPFFSKHLMLQL